MNPDFHRALIAFLMRHRKVGIPNLGNFYLERKGNTLNSPSNIIFPSNYALHSTENGYENLSAFEDFIMRMFRFGKSKAKNFITESVDYILDILKEQKSVILPDFGEFKKEGDKILFYAVDDILQDQSFGLPELKLIPIIRTANENQGPLLDDLGRIQGVVEKKQWILSEIVIALGLIVLIFSLSWLTFNSLNELIFDTSSIAQSQQDGPGRKEMMSPIITQEENLDDKMQNVQVQADEDFNADFIDSLKKGESDIFTRELIIPRVDLDTTLMESLNKACIIIVGSFKKVGNRDRMLEQLKSEGYQTHMEQYGSFYRVGVMFDCLTMDLYNMLYVLRGKVDEQAWILKY